MNEIIEKLKTQNLKGSLHFELARAYAAKQKWTEAISCYRSAKSLGFKHETLDLFLASAYLQSGYTRHCNDLLNIKNVHSKPVEAAYAKLKAMADQVPNKPLSDLNHNLYFRMKTLAECVLKDCNNPKETSILDIGGGRGELSLFLPEMNYVLVEPKVNGLDGRALTFEEHSFDYVVCCHVFEHIEKQYREEFLDTLCRLSRKKVILLNPFKNPNGATPEYDQITFQITNADWAQEHLDCVMPAIEAIHEYGKRKNLNIQYTPNGTSYFTFALVMMEHFANKAKCHQELAQIQSFLNTIDPAMMNQPESPNGYLVEIETGEYK